MKNLYIENFNMNLAKNILVRLRGGCYGSNFKRVYRSEYQGSEADFVRAAEKCNLNVSRANGRYVTVYL